MFKFGDKVRLRSACRCLECSKRDGVYRFKEKTVSMVRVSTAGENGIHKTVVCYPHELTLVERFNELDHLKPIVI